MAKGKRPATDGERNREIRERHVEAGTLPQFEAEIETLKKQGVTDVDELHRRASEIVNFTATDSGTVNLYEDMLWAYTDGGRVEADTLGRRRLKDFLDESPKDFYMLMSKLAGQYDESADERKVRANIHANIKELDAFLAAREGAEDVEEEHPVAEEPSRAEPDGSVI